jgi:hypothetical protein
MAKNQAESKTETSILGLSNIPVQDKDKNS